MLESSEDTIWIKLNCETTLFRQTRKLTPTKKRVELAKARLPIRNLTVRKIEASFGVTTSPPQPEFSDPQTVPEGVDQGEEDQFREPSEPPRS